MHCGDWCLSIPNDSVFFFLPVVAFSQVVECCVKQFTSARCGMLLSSDLMFFFILSRYFLEKVYNAAWYFLIFCQIPMFLILCIIKTSMLLCFC